MTIFTFHDQVKGNIYDTVAAAVMVVPFTIALWDVEARLGFDMEDRIGWSLVPFAMFVGTRMRVARHLLDRAPGAGQTGPGNIAASVGLALYAANPDLCKLGTVLYITTVCSSQSWRCICGESAGQRFATTRGDDRISGASSR